MLHCLKKLILVSSNLKVSKLLDIHVVVLYVKKNVHVIGCSTVKCFDGDAVGLCYMY